MPFALVIIGLILILSGYQNTHAALGKQLAADFTGEGNFFWWVLAIGVVGAIGYATRFQTASRMFMALILIAMVLKNGGVFDKVREAIARGPVTPTPEATPSLGGAIASDLLGSSNPGSDLMGRMVAPFSRATRQFFGLEN